MVKLHIYCHVLEVASRMVIFGCDLVQLNIGLNTQPYHIFDFSLSLKFIYP